MKREIFTPGMAALRAVAQASRVEPVVATLSPIDNCHIQFSRNDDFLTFRLN